jgi:hypothetical protein
MHSIVATRRLFVSLFLVSAMLFALAASAAADPVTGTSTVNAGELTMDASDAPAVDLTLDGTDHTVSDEFDITVNDDTGSGAGWNLQITSTIFSADGGKTLAADTAAITGVSVANAGAGTYTAPVNGTTYGPLTVPAGAAEPGVKFFSAAADTGMGRFKITPTFQVFVPANAYAGNYSSTITITVASGP